MASTEIVSTAVITAVAYARMSTDAQDHSIRHQLESINAYAAANGLVIRREFVDKGRSGLSLFNRPALQQLLAAATDGTRDFSVIVVYDVSRWGRFQDADESAFYEYMCRNAGVSIVYCAENFIDDGSPLYAIMKSIKRVMAAEYSRELSAKVFKAQCTFSRMGYKQGGRPGYGLRRIPIAVNGDAGISLGPGERKPMLTDRVSLTPGSPDEVATVRRIYAWYIDDGLSDTRIAERLRADGAKTHMGIPWDPATVRRILTNERYCGQVFFNKTTRRMRSRAKVNPEDQWICCDRALEPIVTLECFQQARKLRQARAAGPSRATVLAGIQALYAQHGTINTQLCKASTLPGRDTIVRLFGGYVKAYAAAGLPPLRSCGGALGIRTMRIFVEQTLTEVIDKATQAGASVRSSAVWNVLTLNGEINLKVSVASCRHTDLGDRWRIPMRKGGRADFVLCAVMDPENVGIRYYLLLATADTSRDSMYLSERTLGRHTQNRFESLGAAFGLAENPVRDSREHLP